MKFEAKAKLIIQTPHIGRILTKEEQGRTLLAVEQNINEIGRFLVKGDVPIKDDFIIGLRIHITKGAENDSEDV